MLQTEGSVYVAVSPHLTVTQSMDTLIELFAHLIVLSSAHVTTQLQITLQSNWRSSSQTMCDVTTGDSVV